MKKIAIIGVGGFGREVKILIDHINEVEPQYDIVGFYDDGDGLNSEYNGIPYMGKIEELNRLPESMAVAVGVGDPHTKAKILSQISNPDLYFPVLIHPSVIMGQDDITIGKGTIICANSILTCNIHIAEFVTVNLCCTIGHDTEVSRFSSFMPGVNISGEVVIQERVYVGTGAKIINQVEVGKSTIIGAGAVVAKSLPANCTAVGLPAKPIKFHDPDHFQH
ncbi:acetyltransferase [Kaistella pullorum]|uniref:Acetyltransferase n=1 Tax=Kaistella pullorum TaxID=2763074 RepID=A0ABR8WJZ8_9FLAO|nr:acetyltransferase [Kaistella pullorum]MBD8017016.1 acetyltransferase [Kaistella pullorum]